MGYGTKQRFCPPVKVVEQRAYGWCYDVAVVQLSMAPCSLALVLGGKCKTCPYDFGSLVGTHGAKQCASAKDKGTKVL